MYSFGDKKAKFWGVIIFGEEIVLFYLENVEILRCYKSDKSLIWRENE